MEQTIYIAVDVKERKPKIEGWYNLITDASPPPCGRAWFDGKQFKLKDKCHDYSTLLANGWKLFWLEAVQLPSDEDCIQYIQTLGWNTDEGSAEVCDMLRVYKWLRNLMLKRK